LHRVELLHEFGLKQQLATSSSTLIAPHLGAWLASALFRFPSLVLLIALSLVYIMFGQQPWWPAFCGIVAAISACLNRSPAVAGQSARGRSVP
jgi:chromate transporter